MSRAIETYFDTPDEQLFDRIGRMRGHVARTQIAIRQDNFESRDEFHDLVESGARDGLTTDGDEIGYWAIRWRETKGSAGDYYRADVYCEFTSPRQSRRLSEWATELLQQYRTDSLKAKAKTEADD